MYASMKRQETGHAYHPSQFITLSVPTPEKRVLGCDSTLLNPRPKEELGVGVTGDRLRRMERERET